MKKIVLDTCVLLHDKEVLNAFEDNDVCLPITVLEELDHHKTRQDIEGRNARAIIRQIDALREQGSLSDGVRICEGLGKLWVESDNISYGFKHLPPSNDNYLLGTARRLAEKFEPQGIDVVFVTKDINLRIKADVLGITAQDYLNERIEGPLPGEIMHMGLERGEIECFYSDPEYGLPSNGFQENACVIATEPGGSPSILLRVKKGRLRRVKVRKDVQGICPRNAEQRFFVDMLLDPDIDCVLVNGCAGSGKTLLSLAAGLEWMNEKRGKRRMLIAKILEDIGKDVGALPGTLDEKLAPWTRPFWDNLELLMDDDYLRMHLEKKLIEVDCVTFFRGRSIMGRWIIVDELQNLPAKHLKTIVSRPGDGSKLVLLGDLEQIDNPTLSAENCALAHGMAGLYGKEGAGVLTMQKNERGRLARLAQYL
jgi:PhoH-like ATPase